MLNLHMILVFISVLNFTISQCPSEDYLDADVLIFGAGITGVTAAKRLYEAGITNIKVLEARSDSIGGRIRSTTFGGATIELGANWIQEIPEKESERNRHPLWKLAKHTPECANLVGHFTGTYEFWDTDSNGQYKKVDQSLVESLLTQIHDAYKSVELLSQERQKNNQPDISIRKAFDIVNYKPRTKLEQLVEWYKFDFTFAELPNATSLYTGLPVESLGDKDYFISDQRGFSKVVDCIAQGIESKIELGTLVNNITWSDNCVCASVTNNGRSKNVCGKYGVVTFSIGVLQNWISDNVNKFSPPLNAAKQRAINASEMAYYLKIFIQFNKTFWNSKVDDILRTDDQRGYLPMFSPVGQLFPGSPSMLIVTVVEREAERLSTQDKEKTKEEIMAMLREIYGSNIPNITDILIPTWINDPLYRGMYSNTPVGFTKTDQIILKEPEGNLFLSGEALSIEYFGYTHGGYCEGYSTADCILELEGKSINKYKLPTCPSSPPSLLPHSTKML